MDKETIYQNLCYPFRFYPTPTYTLDLENRHRYLDNAINLQLFLKETNVSPNSVYLICIGDPINEMIRSADISEEILKHHKQQFPDFLKNYINNNPTVEFHIVIISPNTEYGNDTFVPLFILTTYKDYMWDKISQNLYKSKKFNITVNIFNTMFPSFDPILPIYIKKSLMSTDENIRAHAESTIPNKYDELFVQMFDNTFKSFLDVVEKSKSVCITISYAVFNLESSIMARIRYGQQYYLFPNIVDIFRGRDSNHVILAEWAFELAKSTIYIDNDLLKLQNLNSETYQIKYDDDINKITKDIKPNSAIIEHTLIIEKQTISIFTADRNKKQYDIKYIEPTTTSMAKNDITNNTLYGLENLGGTCYLNSILQCISNSTYLRGAILSIKANIYNDKMRTNILKHIESKSTNNKTTEIEKIILKQEKIKIKSDKDDTDEISKKVAKDTPNAYNVKTAVEEYQLGIWNRHNDFDKVRNRMIVHQLKELLKFIWAKSDKDLEESSGVESIKPLSFKRTLGDINPVFRSDSRFQDSQEALISILDIMTEETKNNAYVIKNTDSVIVWKNYIKSYSYISSTFTGLIQTVRTCKSCAKKTTLFSPFNVLTLTVPNKETVSLEDLLKSNFKDSLLDKDNMVICDKCKKKREHIESTTIVSYPKVLIIHLLIYRYENMRKKKIKTKISIPFSNLIVKTQTESHSYNLESMSCHLGTTLDNGHYVTISKNKGSWYLLDDEDINKLNDDILSPEVYISDLGCDPYVLFYSQG